MLTSVMLSWFGVVITALVEVYLDSHHAAEPRTYWMLGVLALFPALVWMWFRKQGD